MKDKYILAIDGGTQSTKLVIFDMQGNAVCQGQQVLRSTQAPQTGWVEHPGDDLWDALIAASHQLFSRFTGAKEDIIGVGLCTIRCCRVYLKADGSLAYPVIGWMDPRAYGPFGFPTKESRYATTSTGYMTHRLTGNLKDTIANNTVTQWPTDMVNWKWSDDDALFRQFNVSREQMLEACLPGDILGTVTRSAAEATGIPQGIPVVATASDKAVEALGAGLSLSGDTCLVSLGTYITSMVCGNEYRTRTPSFWTNFASVPHKYMYESLGIARGMWIVSWLKDLLGDEVALKAKAQGISPEAFLDKEAERISPGCDGLLTIVEWLGGPNKRYKKGIMMGFDGRHTRAHMYRSIMEGIAFTIKNNFDSMAKELNISPQKVIVSGGGSNGNIFMRIFADVFGIPAIRNVINGSASLGSAICVAVATGMYADYEEASKHMVQVRDEFSPIMKNHDLYSQVNEEVYRHITGVTDEFLKKTAPIFG
jgi:sugar (pentulose or hexulose) kinase